MCLDISLDAMYLNRLKIHWRFESRKVFIVCIMINDHSILGALLISPRGQTQITLYHTISPRYSKNRG
jgi:hypothetical protein